jgi:hypothetical protein
VLPVILHVVLAQKIYHLKSLLVELVMNVLYMPKKRSLLLLKRRVKSPIGKLATLMVAFVPQVPLHAALEHLIIKRGNILAEYQAHAIQIH